MPQGVLNDIRTAVNITLWLDTIRREHAQTTDPVKRAFLGKLYGEFARRLPE